MRNYLLSYAGGKNSFDLNEDVLQNPQCNLLVDSGAFSAWSKGVPVELGKLLTFCVQLRDRCQCVVTFINLDVIPGSRNVRPTAEQREESARLSFINWQQMRSAGLHTMNVYHQHESPRWLERMAADSDYIGVSPANDVSVQERDEWLDRTFDYIGARVKTHAFGVTATQLLARYPFFSADSTTWMNGAKYGTYVVLLPETANIVQLQRPESERHKGRMAHEVVRFSKDLTYRYRVGIREFLRYERLVTDLWTEKGLTWT